MSARTKIITTVTVVWLAAAIGIVAWFTTHKVVDKYSMEEYTRLTRNGPVPRPPIVVDTTAMMWSLSAVTAVALVVVLITAVWTKPGH